jgi:integrase/recombinase XerD
MERTEGSILRSNLLFCNKNGKAIRRASLWYCFSKLQQSAGFKKTSSGHAPRLHDLKFTFAVHRLSCSIQKREKLNEIIPALSTYMGYASLTKAEEYLSYVPERFKNDLRKLSPMKGQRHWRDEAGLLAYLKTL